MQLAFDAYHFGADRAAIELLPKFAGRIAIVHLADGHAPRSMSKTEPAWAPAPCRCEKWLQRSVRWVMTEIMTWNWSARKSKRPTIEICCGTRKPRSKNLWVEKGDWLRATDRSAVRLALPLGACPLFRREAK